MHWQDHNKVGYAPGTGNAAEQMAHRDNKAQDNSDKAVEAGEDQKKEQVQGCG